MLCEDSRGWGEDPRPPGGVPSSLRIQAPLVRCRHQLQGVGVQSYNNPWVGYLWNYEQKFLLVSDLSQWEKDHKNSISFSPLRGHTHYLPYCPRKQNQERVHHNPSRNQPPNCFILSKTNGRWTAGVGGALFIFLCLPYKAQVSSTLIGTLWVLVQ